MTKPTQRNRSAAGVSRRAGESVVGTYEKTCNAVAGYQDKVADRSRVAWLASIGHGQANLTREVSKIYATTARELIK